MGGMNSITVIGGNVGIDVCYDTVKYYILGRAPLKETRYTRRHEPYNSVIYSYASHISSHFAPFETLPDYCNLPSIPRSKNTKY